jgi:hypothetical protein
MDAAEADLPVDDDPNIVSVGRIRADILKAHVAACVAASKRIKGGKDDDNKGTSSADLVAIIIHNEAIIGTGKTSWPVRVCDDVMVGGLHGGHLRDFLQKPFTGIVLAYASDGMIRYQASIIPVSTIKNMDKGERYEVWLSHKPLLQMLSTQSSADNLILMFKPSDSRLEIILGVSDACGEADGEDMPIMTTPEGSGIEEERGYYNSLGGMLDMDADHQPKHVLLFGASRLVSKLRSKQQKATDVCTLTIKTSNHGSTRSAVVFGIGDINTRRSKTVFYFDRETADIAWADCRDPMANALPIDMVKMAHAVGHESHPRKKIRFETAEDFNTFVMGGDEDDDEEEMPEPGQVGEEMSETVRTYNEVDTMKKVTEFKFRLEYLLKALEPICGDLATIYLLVHIAGADDGDQQLALVDLIASTTQSRGMVVGRFISVQE